MKSLILTRKLFKNKVKEVNNDYKYLIDREYACALEKANSAAQEGYLGNIYSLNLMDHNLNKSEILQVTCAIIIKLRSEGYTVYPDNNIPWALNISWGGPKLLSSLDFIYLVIIPLIILQLFCKFVLGLVV